MQKERNGQVWSQPTQYIVTILLFGAGLVFVFFARPLFASLLIAAVITYILNPISRLFEFRVGLSHRAAASAAYFVFFLGVVAVLASSTPVIIDRASIVSLEFQGLLSDLNNSLAQNPSIFGFEIPVNELLLDLQTNTTEYFVPADIIAVAGNFSSNLVWVLVSAVTVFYLLQDWHKLRDWGIEQVPPFRRNDFVRLYVEIKLIWQAYLRGQLVLMIVVGIASGIGAAALGLRGAWFIGLLAGLMDIVPSVGPTIAAIVAVSIAWLTGSSYLPVSPFVFAIIILGLFVVIQTIENVWWRPRILGESLKIHPALIFIGVMTSLTLGGVFLTLIIVPVMGTVGVLWYYLRARMLGIELWADDELDESTLAAFPQIVRARIEEEKAKKTSPNPLETA